MLSKQKYFLSIYRFFKKLFNKPRIPEIIASDEKIVRSVFSPMNLKKGVLKPNTFQPPTNSDKISVSRLNYATVDKIKDISKKISDPENNRSYYGLAVLYACEIRNTDSDVVYSPNKINKYHSDIKIGYVIRQGEAVPAEINYKIKQLHDKARFYVDPKPKSVFWEGDDVK